MIELYSDYFCPFCVKVLRFLDGKSHDVVFKDIRREPAWREALKKVNNNITQVPCLVVDGVPMLESDDIIAYLEEVLK